MKRPPVLHYLLWLGGIMVLLYGCGGPSELHTQTPTAPVASSTTSLTQLKPQGALPSSCPVTPIYQGGPPNPFITSALPWVQAQPTSSGIIGHLFFTGTTAGSGTYRFLHTGGGYPDGSSTKILWTIDHPHILNQIQIDGTNLSSAGMTFHQTIDPGVGSWAVPSPEQYPSIVVVPSAGCWRLQISSGLAQGILILWVVGKKG
jgi:hypothetical protein